MAFGSWVPEEVRSTSFWRDLGSDLGAWLIDREQYVELSFSCMQDVSERCCHPPKLKLEALL